MKMWALIPVRMSISSFKGKPMALKTGKTITPRVFEATNSNSYSLLIEGDLEIVTKHFEN